MTNKLKIEKIMNLTFLLTIFFIPIEMAMTLKIGSLSPYKISFAVLTILLIYNIATGSFKTYFKSFIKAFSKFKWAIISIVLYFIFDIISLAWTKDIIFSLKKYATIAPMIILSIYATYYFFGPNVNPTLRKERLRNLAMCFGIVALSLSIFTWITYFIFNRTYYIMTLSLQSDYNQYVLPIILGYVCGVYFINTMRNCWQKYMIFAAYSTILMPNFYLSGSRRVMAIYLIVFAFLSLSFLITNMVNKKSLGTFLISVVIIAGVVASHKIIIDGFEYHSKYVYKTMEEEATKKGIKAPSAQMDKSQGIIHGFRLENDASYKESTLETGQAMGRREILWTLALRDIKNFSKKELLIGKGGSQQRDLYRTKEAREMLFADGTPDLDQDFHPHSMILIEMLNGGAIKTILVLSVVLSIIFYDFVNLFRKNYQEFVMISGFGGIFLASQMIDSIYGLLQNRMTWIYLFIVLASLGELKKTRYKIPY